jgi:hypothetical protein
MKTKTAKITCKKPARRDAFVNATFLYEQTGGHFSEAIRDLSYEINHRLDRISKYDWCPPDIRAEIESSLRYLGKAANTIGEIRDFVAEKARSTPITGPQRILNQPRLGKLIVIRGGGN